jgi:uncharacterized integral membrane protein
VEPPRIALAILATAACGDGVAGPFTTLTSRSASMSDAQHTSRARAAAGSTATGNTTVSIKLIVGALVLVGVAFFVFQNTQTVPLRWLVFEFSMPLWGLTLVLFGAGMLMGWALHIRRLKRRTS